MRLFVYVVLILSASFVSGQTTLKISTLYPAGTDAVASLKQAAEHIKTQSQGEVVLKIYPGGVMGDDKTVLRKIKIGQLQGALVSGSGLDLIEPNLKDISQPFQFENLSQVYQARESADAEFRGRLNDKKWRGYGPLDGGFSYLMSKQPIADMAGVREAKLWLPNTNDIQALSRQLKVNYLVMGIGDVLTGLDTGAIDALISPPSAAIALNWYSRFNYIAETPVIYTFGMLVLPERAFSKLSDEHEILVQTSLSEWAENLDGQLRQDNERAKQAIEQLLEAQKFNAGDVENLKLSQR